MIVGKKEIGTGCRMVTDPCIISRKVCLGDKSCLHLNIFVGYSASPHCRYLVPCVGKFTTNNVCMTLLMTMSLKGTSTGRSI